MMMSKPVPAKENSSSSTLTMSSKPATSSDAVADLERRLAQLGSFTTAPAKADSAPSLATTSTNASAAAEAPAAAARVPVKGGKNALLARIMAAQERSKQYAPTTTPSMQDDTVTDLLNGEVTKPNQSPPPPPFDDALLPSPPPPPFDATILPPAKVTSSLPPSTYVFDPLAPAPHFDAASLGPPPAFLEPPSPSAPDYEDLLENHQQMPPPSIDFLPPPVQAPSSEIDVNANALDEVMGLQGLSAEEKRALIEEQEKIMAAIQGMKSANQASVASARADAFESRSHQAAVQAIARGNVKSHSNPVPRTVSLGGQELALHGQEQTQQAIADGTALMVQCLACENWMQVTQSATLMFCPVCQTVSPVLHEDAEAAKQMQRDMELAEQLQKEEYKRADQTERQTSARQNAPAASSAPPSTSSSWLEWLGMSSSTKPAATSPERPMSFAQPPAQRGEVAVSRPPGSSITTPSPRFHSAQTDTFRPVFDSEQDSMPLTRRSAARVAERQPLFNCVADSITSAASSLTTGLITQTFSQDDEGNVHGVDSSSLLAVPMVGRNTAGKDEDYYKAHA